MDVEAGAAVRRAGRESNVLLLKWGRWRCGGVETAREKDEDNKRSWRVFRGDLVSEMGSMALRRIVAHGWIARSVFLAVWWVSRRKRT